jgi:hypothetical protein
MGKRRKTRRHTQIQNRAVQKLARNRFLQLRKEMQIRTWKRRTSAETTSKLEVQIKAM